MSKGRGRRKAHAILARDMQRPGGRERPGGTGSGEPFLPEIGEVYQIVSLVYGSSDPAGERPCVVVLVPRAPHQRIGIVTRTSDVNVEGVAHPKDVDLGLNRNGVFAGYNSVEQHLWSTANVRYLGRLHEPWLTKVLEMSQ
jgi:hypothetical protein